MQDLCFARKVLSEDFLYEEHVNYLLKLLKRPASGTPVGIVEAHRLSTLFFVVSGLDLLGALDTRLSRSDREDIIEWIYSHQVDINKVKIPCYVSSLNDGCDNDQDNEEGNEEETSTPKTRKQNTGRSTTTATTKPVPTTPTNNAQSLATSNANNLNNNNTSTNNTITLTPTSILSTTQATSESNTTTTNTSTNTKSPKPKAVDKHTYQERVGYSGFRATSMMNNDVPSDCGALTMNYCALATLIILGDDLKRVDRKSIIAGMKQMQLPDGSFKPSVLGGETDMRLVYCAAAVSRLLNDWSGIDKDECAKFIRNSLSYEGAFAQCPGAEAHGGSTYCALASLKLMSKLEDTLSQEEIDRLIRWCINRFDHGFSGRPNKDQDTCYSFWIGACLVILDHFKFIEQKNLLEFILQAQEERGGLSKVPDFYPDPLHTYLGFAGLTFVDDSLCSARRINLLKLDPTLNISVRAKNFLEKLHDHWNRGGQIMSNCP